jgi:hypothetical protein
MSRRSETTVAAWQRRMRLTDREAARILGVSLSSYQEHKRGLRWNDGSPVPQSQLYLLACAAIEAGIEPIL